MRGMTVLLSDLFELLQQVETDMTLFFRRLMEIPVDGHIRSDMRQRAGWR